MVEYGLAGLGILLGSVIFAIIYRTLRFSRFFRHAPSPYREELINKNRAVESLQEMIRFPTISYMEEEKIDNAAFDGFRAYLIQRYPLIHAHMERIEIPPRGLLYRLPGNQSTGNPTVLMSHYDVVPVSSTWTHPPFSGELIDGEIWGRGTLDTKGTLCSILEATETLLERGFQPKEDLYFSFGGDEEIFGESAVHLVDYFEKNQIRPRMVLDEGGAVVTNVFPGVKQPTAVVGIAEKGVLNVSLTAKSSGGHASTPPKHTAIGELASAVHQLERHPFPMHLTPATKAMLETLGSHSSSFGLRMIFCNLWLFSPLVRFLFGKMGGEMAAFLRTTCAVTMAEGSPSPNVLPGEAKFIANLRILSGENIRSTVDRIERIIRNPKISVQVLAGHNPSPVSTMEDAYSVLQQAILATWQESIVSPYLMMAASDSRHYNRISDGVYRFSAMELSKEDRSRIHADNERIAVEKLLKCVEFYQRLIASC